MARLTIYEYDRKNRDRIVSEIEKANSGNDILPKNPIILLFVIGIAYLI